MEVTARPHQAEALIAARKRKPSPESKLVDAFPAEHGL